MIAGSQTQWLYHEQDDLAVLERTKKVVLEAIMAGRQGVQRVRGQTC